jgi:hypothetical protein
MVSDIKESIEIFNNAQRNSNTPIAEQSASKIKSLMLQIYSLKEEIEREQVYAKPWMNLMAQQDTMRFHSSKCGSCYQSWIPGSEVFNSDQAKKFLNEAKRKNLKGFCGSCGQKLPNKP